MEEEKAAEYYDELVRTGGNAAKYKQGLGFGTSATSVAKSEAHGSLTNFVKESSPGRAAALKKEIRIESIRDKLKKREENPSRVQRRSDDDGNKAGSMERRRGRSPGYESVERRRGRSPSHESVERRRGRSPSYESRDRKKESSRRRRRSSSGTSDTGPVKKSSARGKRRSRSPARSNVRSPGDEKGKNKAHSAAGERESRQKRKRSGSSSPSGRSRSSGESSDRSKKRNRPKREDRSVSPTETSRRTTRRRRSPHRSYEGRRRDRSRSRSRGRGADRKRNRSNSPPETRRRGRSRSPPSYRSSHYHRDSRRDEDRYRDSSRRDVRPSGRYRDREVDDAAHRPSLRTKEKPPERDYSKDIPNFDTMTPAEKVKAKMKLQLAETVVKDRSNGMSNEWERFDFSKDAPLDDDAKLDYFGDGTGANDDTVFLKNTGSSYLSSSNQVAREAKVTAAHEAAIFGPPEGLKLKTSKLEGSPAVKKSQVIDEDTSDLNAMGQMINGRQDHKSPTSLANSVVSEQVIAMQQAGSWQDRARKMREDREAALAS